MSNFVLIMVILIFGASFYRGSKKGLVRTVFGLFSSIVVLLAGTVISPVLSNQFRNNEKLFNAISTRVEKSIENYQKADNNTKGSDNKLQINKKNNKKDNKKKDNKKKVKNIKDELYMPQNLPGGDKVFEEIVSDILKNEHLEKAKEDIQKEVNHRVAIYLTGIVINSGTFILVYFLLSTGLYILGRVLNIISKLPVLKELNSMGGGIAGLFQGLVIVWLIFTLMAVFIDKPLVQAGMEQIEKNMFLTLLYKSNIIAKVIGFR
ncbi:MAG: CvpA family protein [Catonella sp.]|uniref:CvpA family protein n=1 Tax=Catonella sp. TaxID=2382125 RepID=UPI003F9FA484